MKRVTSTFAIVVASMLIGAAIVMGIDFARSDNDSGAKTASTTSATRQVSNNNSSNGGAQPAADFSALYQAVRPSIVEITTGTQGSGPFSQQREGLGSGIVLDEEGHILTNFHVVRGFDNATVTFSDGTVAQAKVVGRDPGDDLALIKVSVDPGELQPAKLGDSGQLKVGNPVFAIGNPFGLDGTLTTGVISGLNRTLTSANDGRPIRGLIQTDTAVNPGNSGGALFNLQGEVIGINTAIENPGGNTFAGVAYAVPINTPKRFLAQLTEGKTIGHPRLGISGRTLSPDDARRLGVPYGVAVVSVDSGSAADKAGLKASANGSGDVIVAIEGKPTKTFDDLANYIDAKGIGDEVTLTVHRDGKDIQLTAKLQAWDSTA